MARLALSVQARSASPPCSTCSRRYAFEYATLGVALRTRFTSNFPMGAEAVRFRPPPPEHIISCRRESDQYWRGPPMAAFAALAWNVVRSARVDRPHPYVTVYVLIRGWTRREHPRPDR